MIHNVKRQKTLERLLVWMFDELSMSQPPLHLPEEFLFDDRLVLAVVHLLLVPHLAQVGHVLQQASLAIRRSQSSARPMPPPMQKPSIMAMVGLPMPWMAAEARSPAAS